MTTTPDERLLLPENQPEAPRTRTVNKVPLMLVGLAALSFMLMMVWVAYQRAGDPLSGGEETPKMGNSRMYAEEITGGYDGLIPPDLPAEIPAAPEPKTPEDGPSLPVATRDAPRLDAPPLPPGRLAPSPDDDMLMRIRAAKFQQFEQALQSKTGVETANVRRASGGTAPMSDNPSREEVLAKIQEQRRQIEAFSNGDPAQAYKARMEALRSAGGAPAAGGGGMDAPPSVLSASAARNDYNSFGQPGREDRWTLENPAITNPSRYMLRAGATVMPATLISGINSDLPGQVQAQISQDIYDTATGKYLLVPQGTRLVGQYSSDIAYGQERVLMAWQRLIFPDGRALDLGAMPGADSAGYAGYSDQVNTHFFRAIGSAFLMSGVIAAVNLSQDRSGSRDSNNQRSSDALSEALGQTMGQTLMQYLQKNLNVAPTLEIRPGYRLNVMVTKDIHFPEPYKAFSY